ncbi:spermidine synthase [Legionella drozanskii]|uniref:Spermidine synthase n=1 Tax=Legionella drozanskii LLAP-1 TaxID=1212489 RepID=A0A0W0SRC8_9GAMM|nr:fused MFS/spermidine synthase [Legionella drozanskii]KTC85809.1 spermidine synthase [Legionella drozanskii LLAP-1]
MIPLLFSINLFLSAFLLFVIQPLVAKLLLPIYGGTPAVWTVCMLFFQFLLLLAYGYAWLLSRFARWWVWRVLHGLLVLLSLMALPLSFTPSSNSGSPDLAILNYLITHLGLPLIVIGASAPLLQFAYSQTRAKYASDPYFLYALSNIGSLLALLAYPFGVERYLGLKLQFDYWKLGFAIYAIFLFILLVTIPKQKLLESSDEKSQFSWRIRLCWIGYSFIPCSLMLGVSFYISTDIAATPLFWVIPLAIYLLSFIISFAQKPIISHEWVMRNTLLFIIFPVLGFIVGIHMLLTWQLILFHLASFFMLALLCLGELVRIRPSTSQLTSFYFCIALGGALAGLFNGLLAPRLFSGSYEYPLIFAAAMLCISLPKSTGVGSTVFILFALELINYFLPNQLWLKTNHILEILALSLILIWPKNSLNLFGGMAILFVFLFSPWFKSMETLTQQRNFYGVKQVLSVNGAHVLVSQNILHGFQFTQDQPDNSAMAYYNPVLSAVQHLQTRHPALNASLIGLGTGMMACQFRANDRLEIIDIDRQVINIASNTNYFTYLRDCPPKISVIEGDGRIVLHDNPETNLDLVVVDAFSSDAIPTHLLTLEAFKLYQHKIKEDGVILVNISNRHLHLLPIIITASRELELIVLHKQQAENYFEGKFPAEWVLLTTNQAMAVELMQNSGWRFAAEEGSRWLWTDDYSNLAPLVNWGKARVV